MMLPLILFDFFGVVIRRLRLPGFSKAVIFTLLVSLLSPLAGPVAYAVDVPEPLAPCNSPTYTAVAESGGTVTPPVALPEFSWAAVSGATRYRLQLSQEIGFNNIKLEVVTPLTRYTPTNIGQLNDGEWYWRVRVDAPTASQYSDIFYPSCVRFTKDWASENNQPGLIEPADLSTVEFFDSPSFSWSVVSGAAYYRFQISIASDFSTLAYNLTTLATSHQPKEKLANGTYYWRVIPLDVANREGTYSPVWSFQMGYNQVPQLLEPDDLATPTFTPTFRWTAVRGASVYNLQYSTDPSFNSAVTNIDTRNTSFTPTSLLPNDVNYYWRVRARSGNSISVWSVPRSFKKQWYILPVLLTPTNNYLYVRFPFFSWTPVPGASYYKFELADNIAFNNPMSIINTSNPYAVPDGYSGIAGIRYWRVTPYDKNNFKGQTTVPSSYVSYQEEIAPEQTYPLYYYTPNNFPSPDESVVMQPHEDRTVPLPIFMWQRSNVPYPVGGIYADAYRLEVSADPLFYSVDWTVTTENLAAAPTLANNFTPLAGTDYYWRVCALVASVCANPDAISQVWVARIDSSLTLTPTTGASPQLIRPARASEHVEMTPLFEWWPFAGADSYEIQISLDPAFGTLVDSATVPYPAYAPKTVLAQRDLLNRLAYGTYYWRVRARSGGSPLGSWSAAWRFQVASQSLWKASRTAGDAQAYRIAQDPDDVPNNNYELTGLYATQDKDYWYFGFDVPTSFTANVTYTLYLDLDHLDSSGGTSDARGFTLTTIPAHRPEYSIYIFEKSGVFNAGNVVLYAWTGSTWGVPRTLSSVGGTLYNPNTGYIEIKVPNTAIGMSPTTGSYTLSLASFANVAGSSPQDSVPNDPNVPGSGALSRFSSVSERMMVRMPPTDVEGDPAVFSSIPPYYWEYPTGSNGTAPWAGCTAEANPDPLFTGQPVANYTQTSTGAYYASTVHPWLDDFDGDNTYYWRIKPRYLDNDTPYFGVWSESIRIERRGFVPVNLKESVSFATPSFTWDLVEGAETYDLQVDNDPNFGSTEININTAQNSYTSPNTLPNGNYNWRVRIRRWGNVINEWSAVKQFTLALPKPSGLSPNDPSASNVLGKAPTLCWNPILVSSGGQPVLAAWKYRLQVSRGDPSFSAIYDSMDTEQACWTPVKGYDDGTYYWRVAMIDGQSRLGDYSSTAVFTKQYPVSTLVSPLDGQSQQETPTFVWTPVEGAGSYRLEISQSNTFAPIYDSVTTNTVVYSPIKEYATQKTYYWRVAIIDRDGRIGPFNNATIILDPNAGKGKLYLPMILR